MLIQNPKLLFFFFTLIICVLYSNVCDARGAFLVRYQYVILDSLLKIASFPAAYSLGMWISSYEGALRCFIKFE